MSEERLSEETAETGGATATETRAEDAVGNTSDAPTPASGPEPTESRPSRAERGAPAEGRTAMQGPRAEGARGPRAEADRGPRASREPGREGNRPEASRREGQREAGGRASGTEERRSGPPGRDRRPEAVPEIDLEKLIADSLYLDNQAHAIVSRLRDMDSGTKSQLRRFYNALRRACRAPESERQHEFVMLRARLAYTNARHSLRSLDPLEKLLLQVTRKNELRGYERFRDLFEAIVAYNE